MKITILRILKLKLRDRCGAAVRGQAWISAGVLPLSVGLLVMMLRGMKKLTAVDAPGIHKSFLDDWCG